MNRTSVKGLFYVALAGLALLSSIVTPAMAVERSLVGVHIYANVRTILLKYGNPTYVLTAGQTVSAVSGSASVTTSGSPQAFGPRGIGQQGMPGGPGGPYGGQFGPTGGAGGPGGPPTGAYGSMGALPPLQPSAGPIAAFGMGGDDAGGPVVPGVSKVDTSGEVTLIYREGDGVSYQFLLSPSGNLLQVTALGYSSDTVKTSRNITFGSSYTDVERKYGYPENQSDSNGVEILDYSSQDHVAFELVNSQVIGIVVAAVD